MLFVGKYNFRCKKRCTTVLVIYFYKLPANPSWQYEKLLSISIFYGLREKRWSKDQIWWLLTHLWSCGLDFYIIAVLPLTFTSFTEKKEKKQFFRKRKNSTVQHLPGVHCDDLPVGLFYYIMAIFEFKPHPVCVQWIYQSIYWFSLTVAITVKPSCPLKLLCIGTNWLRITWLSKFWDLHGRSP